MSVENRAQGSDAFVLARGITKRFPGLTALDQVDLEIRRGEVHGLVGENGSGKSTLARVLAGRFRPDAGHIEVEGTLRRFATPADALKAGIVLVSQEVLTHPLLSVEENLVMGDWPSSAGVLSWRRARVEAAELLESLEIRAPLGATLGQLPLHLQHMVAIAQAVRKSPQLLILDEPTSSLDDAESEKLFALVRRLRDQDIAVLYVTHRMKEYLDLADRITVLRDGDLIADGVPIGDLDEPSIVRLMVGRDVPSRIRPMREVGAQPVRLEVTDLRLRPGAVPVSFTVERGEVLGIAGQAGSGRSSLLRSLFGLSAQRVDLRLDGTHVRVANARTAIDVGIGYVPEDRKRQGVVLTMSVAENVTMPSWRRFSRVGVFAGNGMAAAVQDAAAKFRIKAASPRVLTGTLSGGNQQKVALARWLMRDPRVLLLDEPTRGVDVGAKDEIYQLIEDYVAHGGTVVLASSELPELLRLSDRVLVLDRGAPVGILSAEQADEESITSLAVGAGLSHPPRTPEPRQADHALMQGDRT